MKQVYRCLIVSLLVTTAGCGGSDEGTGAPEVASVGGSTKQQADHGDDHAHTEVPLGVLTLGNLELSLAQGHGAVKAGSEGLLVVKLPYSDHGASIVRAWIGTADRTLSMVSKAQYSKANDSYELHATAPDPLPEKALWWVELQRPGGAKSLGSAEPILE